MFRKLSRFQPLPRSILPLRKLLFIFILCFLVSLSYGLDYFYLSNDEETVWGDYIKWQHGDTAGGIIRSNSQIAIQQDPVFYDLVISTASDFYCAGQCNPVFLGPQPIFNAMPVAIPSQLNFLRIRAMETGNYYDEPYQAYKIVFHGASASVYQWHEGAFFDSTVYAEINAQVPVTAVFFDGPLRVEGIVEGRWSVGSSADIGLDDNVRYADANPETGVTPAESPNYLSLAAEHNVKIRNTYANGRENSGLPCGNYNGFNINHERNSIVITAALYALRGSLTFENQNNPDSGYVYDCAPDRRGQIFLYGAIVQDRRGYVHLASLQSTGYLKHYRYDARLRNWDDGIFQDFAYSNQTDSLNFGDVAVGESVTDTADIYILDGTLGAVLTNAPFSAQRIAPFFGSHFRIPVTFTPTQTRAYNGILTVVTSERTFQIPMMGRGVEGFAPPPITMDIYPNPFNSNATVKYVVSQNGRISFGLYNVLGQEVRKINLEGSKTGEQKMIIDASGLSSGIYFAVLKTEHQIVKQKIMLLK